MVTGNQGHNKGDKSTGGRFKSTNPYSGVKSPKATPPSPAKISFRIKAIPVIPESHSKEPYKVSLMAARTRVEADKAKGLKPKLEDLIAGAMYDSIWNRVISEHLTEEEKKVFIDDLANDGRLWDKYPDPNFFPKLLRGIKFSEEEQKRLLTVDKGPKATSPILSGLADNLRLSDEVKKELAYSGNKKAITNLLNNAKIPEISEYMLDLSWNDQRILVAENINSSRKALETLMKDSNRKIRKAAKKTLKHRDKVIIPSQKDNPMYEDIPSWW